MSQDRFNIRHIRATNLVPQNNFYHTLQLSHHLDPFAICRFAFHAIKLTGSNLASLVSNLAIDSFYNESPADLFNTGNESLDEIMEEIIDYGFNEIVDSFFK